MSELQPIVPRDEATGTGLSMPAQDTPEPVPITEQEVGEYREQDRFLPVSLFPSPPFSDPLLSAAAAPSMRSSIIMRSLKLRGMAAPSPLPVKLPTSLALKLLIALASKLAPPL